MEVGEDKTAAHCYRHASCEYLNFSLPPCTTPTPIGKLAYMSGKAGATNTAGLVQRTQPRTQIRANTHTHPCTHAHTWTQDTGPMHPNTHQMPASHRRMHRLGPRLAQEDQHPPSTRTRLLYKYQSGKHRVENRRGGEFQLST